MIHHTLRCLFWDDGTMGRLMNLFLPRFGPGTVRRGGEIGWEEENASN